MSGEGREEGGVRGGWPALSQAGCAMALIPAMAAAQKKETKFRFEAAAKVAAEDIAQAPNPHHQ
eukprot:4087602-Pyramimonas_sp.AAC.1